MSDNSPLKIFTTSQAVKSSSHDVSPKPKTSSDTSPSVTKPKTPTGESKCSTPKSNTKTNESQLSTPKQPKSSRKRSAPEKKEDNSFDSKDDNQNEAKENKSTNGKRRRIVIASESEDSDEYKPETDHRSDESNLSNEDASETDSPKKKMVAPKVTTPDLSIFNKSKSTPSNSKPSTPITTKLAKTSTPVSKQKACNGTSEKNPGFEVESKEWFHEKLNWLKDDEIRDHKGNPKLHPDYNPRTLHVPADFKETLTPNMRKWWGLKSEHFDTVLFFKVGKFYELYHMDATIGVKELGLSYTRGDNAHSGFPEIALGKYSDCLVEKGYKVARVEQTGTLQMMEQGCIKISRSVTDFEISQLAREIYRITSKGTKTLTCKGEGMRVCNNFVLAICEKHVNEADNTSEYGICFIDTSIEKFNLGQFKDDRHGSRLLTLIASYPPVMILYDKGSVSKRTLQLLNHNLTAVAKQALSPHNEFWDSSKVLKLMQKSEYFNTEKDSIEYPSTIMKMLDLDDRLLLTPLKQYELAFKSLGGCFWYLRECGIDDCLLTMKLFEEYTPVDKLESVSSSAEGFKKHMVLDGITLQKLEIVPLLPSDDSEGTQLGTMDFCSTTFDLASGKEDKSVDATKGYPVETDQGRRSSIGSSHWTYLMWQNNANVCWLNSAMALLVHNQTLFEAFEHSFETQIGNIIRHYYKAVSIFNDCSYSKNINERVTNAKNILKAVQESVLKYLEPIVKFKSGVPDSAFCSLYNIITEKNAVKFFFNFEYFWFQVCNNCKTRRVKKHKKPTVTLPRVEDFQPSSPVSLYQCLVCKAADQKMTLNFKTLPQCLIFHFESGAGEGELKSSSFEVDGRTYQLTGLILLLKQKPINHFKTLIYNNFSKLWLELDDLYNKTVHYSPLESPVQLNQVYIMMYEAKDRRGTISNRALADKKDDVGDELVSGSAETPLIDLTDEAEEASVRDKGQ